MNNKPSELRQCVDYLKDIKNQIEFITSSIKELENMKIEIQNSNDLDEITMFLSRIKDLILITSKNLDMSRYQNTYDIEKSKQICLDLLKYLIETLKDKENELMVIMFDNLSLSFKKL